MTEISIQRFNPFDRGGCQLAGALSARIGRTEIQDVFEESLTQIRLDPDRHGVCADFIDPCQERATRDHYKNQPEPV